VAIALLIVHGLAAVALLGAITHQTIAAWAPRKAQAGSFFNRFRAVPAPSFANAVVVLYLAVAALGAFIYLDFRVEIRPELERGGHWHALGLFDVKEHFISIGLGLLPAYWMCWRRLGPEEGGRMRAALTLILAIIVWWGFLIGHVTNNLMGFRS
jgi:hypothetical protein